MRSSLGPCVVLVSIAALLAPAPVAAQNAAQMRNLRRLQQQSSRPPTVSPYVNLYRDNLPPVFNYYTLVRPQMQQQAFDAREGVALTRLQRELIKDEAAQGTGRREPIRGTRRASRFMDSTRYYNRKE